MTTLAKDIRTNKIWFCRRCQTVRGAQYESGKPKVRAFRNGFVAVFLECGHTAAVNHDRV
jgi:hypothetical protein